MSRLIRCYQNSALLTDRCEGVLDYMNKEEGRFDILERFIEEDKLSEGLKIIEEIEKQDGLELNHITRFMLLKAKILHFKTNYEEAFSVASKALEHAKEIKNPALQLCILSLMDITISWLQSEKKILSFYSKCLIELERMEKEFPNDIEKLRSRYLILLAKATFPSNKERAFELIKESLSLAVVEKNKGLHALIHHIISHMFTDIGEYDKAIEHAQVCQKINEELNRIPSELNQFNRLRSNQSQLGYICMRTGNNEKLIEYGTKHLEYSVKAQDNFSKAYANFLLGTGYGQKGMFRKAIDCALEGYTIWIGMGELFGASWCALTAAVNYRKVGELSASLDFYMKMEDINRKLENNFSIARALQGSGIIYKEKGMPEKAKNNLLEALNIYKQNIQYMYTRPGRDIARSLYYLILISLDIGKEEESMQYLNQFEDYRTNQEVGNVIVEQLYAVSKGVYLLQIGEEEDLIEAEKILNQVIEDEGPDLDVTAMAIFSLCMLNLRKIQKTKNGIVLFQRTESLLNILLRLAEKEKSSILLAEVYSLQSQISLVKMEVQEAERLLIEAQKIAEEGEIDALEMKISRIYDSLLEHLDSWEDFTMKLPSIGEKLELTRMEEMLDELLRFQSLISEHDFTKEEPVLFFITDSKGGTVFADKFYQDLQEIEMKRILEISLDNYEKLKEVEGYIPRFKFHEYTIILSVLDDVYFGYVFIGDSYQSIKNMNRFIQDTESQPILDILRNKTKKNEGLELQERISISELIDEVFITN